MSELEDLSHRIGTVVRSARMARFMSTSELAREAGLSKTIVGRIENGDGNPSIETLWRISTALQVPLGHLLGEHVSPRVRHIPARSGERLDAESGMVAWPLHADGTPRRTEVYAIDLPRGTDQRTEAHLPGTEELVVCVKGRVEVGPVGEEVDLRPGDSVWFVADAPHRYHALENSRTLCWMLYG
jgi:XRE family transcriptional regulator, regulator of sulfur utilization